MATGLVHLDDVLACDLHSLIIVAVLVLGGVLMRKSGGLGVLAHATLLRS